MIRNEVEYDVTLKQRALLQKGLNAHPDDPPEGVHPRLHQAEREGLESQIADLDIELKEWEAFNR